MVGPDNSEGEESFEIEVCTPKWLMENYSSEEIILGRHLLIVQKFDYKSIHRRILTYLAQCTGDNWSEIALKVSRLGKWEFEDYSSS